VEDEAEEAAVTRTSKTDRSQPAYVERADRKPFTTVLNDLADAFDAKPVAAAPPSGHTASSGWFPPPNPLLVIEVRPPAFRIRGARSATAPCSDGSACTRRDRAGSGRDAPRRPGAGRRDPCGRRYIPANPA